MARVRGGLGLALNTRPHLQPPPSSALPGIVFKRAFGQIKDLLIGLLWAIPVSLILMSPYIIAGLTFGPLHRLIHRQLSGLVFFSADAPMPAGIMLWGFLLFACSLYFSVAGLRRYHVATPLQRKRRYPHFALQRARWLTAVLALLCLSSLILLGLILHTLTYRWMAENFAPPACSKPVKSTCVA